MLCSNHRADRTPEHRAGAGFHRRVPDHGHCPLPTLRAVHGCIAERRAMAVGDVLDVQRSEFRRVSRWRGRRDCARACAAGICRTERIGRRAVVLHVVRCRARGHLELELVGRHELDGDRLAQVVGEARERPLRGRDLLGVRLVRSSAPRARSCPSSRRSRCFARRRHIPRASRSRSPA